MNTTHPATKVADAIPAWRQQLASIAPEYKEASLIDIPMSAQVVGLNAEVKALRAALGRAAVPSVPVQGGLPPLPKAEHDYDAYHPDGAVTSHNAYTAEQMRAYATAAIEQHVIASQSAAQAGASDAARNFCPSCGKRTPPGSIHTCTPPASEPVRGASIDTPEFLRLARAWVASSKRSVSDTHRAWDEIIAHINAWHASQIAAALSEGRKQGAARSAATYSEYIASQSASVEDARATPESAILAQQVASWRKEVARLNDLIAFAGGAVDAPLADAKPLAHGHRDDYYLMANARIMLSTCRAYKDKPNWAIAMNLFATGSTSACQICRDAGIDPAGLKVERACSTGKHGGGRDGEC